MVIVADKDEQGERYAATVFGVRPSRNGKPRGSMDEDKGNVDGPDASSDEAAAAVRRFPIPPTTPSSAEPRLQ